MEGEGVERFASAGTGIDEPGSVTGTDDSEAIAGKRPVRADGGGEMRALEIGEWGGSLRERVRPIPDPDAGEVLLEVDAVGVGRTVANVMAGNMNDDPDALPRIPGHEVVGTVASVGPGVDHVSPGDPATVYFHLVCGHCRFCHEGRDSLCRNHRGWVSAHTDGGFAEYACLPAGNVLPLPEGLDPVAATAIPDAVATPYHVATERARIGDGDRVLVLGAGGGVGIHMVQVATHVGGDVIGVDLSASKLEACLDVGATDVVNAAETDLASAVDGLLDVVIDFTGDMEAVEAATDLLGPRGRLVHLTTFPGRTSEPSPRAAVSNELTVVGSRYCSKHELLAAAELVAEGSVEPVVTESVGFDGVSDLLDRITGNEVVGRGAMRPE